MYIIVGLANPGVAYQNTRHNIGQMAVNKLCQRMNLGRLKIDKSLKTNLVRGEGFIVALPLVYMNESGLTVLSLKKYFKVATKNIWLIHDDIDLKIGSFKISFGRGSAGHQGVQSVINTLKTKDFYRLRLGIQPLTGKPSNTERFVLGKFTRQEKQLNQKVIEEALDVLIKTLQLKR